MNKLFTQIKKDLKEVLEENKAISNEIKVLKNQWKQEALKQEVNKYIGLYLLKVISLMIMTTYILNPLLNVTTINKIFGVHLTKLEYTSVLIPFLCISFLLTIFWVWLDLPDTPVSTYRNYLFYFIQLIEKIVNKFMVILFILPTLIFVMAYFLSNNFSIIKWFLVVIFYVLIKLFISKQNNKIFDTYWAHKPKETLVPMERNNSTIIHTPDGSFTTYHGRLLVLHGVRKVTDIDKKEETDK